MNDFVSSYYGELYHHGVKGMKWGIRRYQNKDGTLTKEGRRRKEILDNASEKANEFSKMAARDSEKYSALAKNVKSKKLSESQYKKAMRDLFGNDSTNKDYVESEAKAMGYENSRQMAAEELGIGDSGSSNYRALADRAKKTADFYQNLSKNFKNADVAYLNKKQIKKASKFVANAYLENVQYREYSLRYNNEKYGL